MEIRVATEVRPTEDEQKVRAAIKALFPDVRLAWEGDRLVGSGADPDTFLKALRDQRIRDTARMVMSRGAEEGRTRFTLSKQAATVGKVNFAVEPGPLGALEVELIPQEMEPFLDSIAPPPPEADHTAERRHAIHVEEKVLEENYEDFTADPLAEDDPAAAEDLEEDDAPVSDEMEEGEDEPRRRGWPEDARRDEE